jgi:hypothetical protein
MSCSIEDLLGADRDYSKTGGKSLKVEGGAF